MAKHDIVMPDHASRSEILAVRRFNRFYTRQIGLLQEGLLDSAFSLTEVRVLYELAQREGASASALCKELGLDHGYLSRMLRSFGKQGLVAKRPSSEDGRQSRLSLTAPGRKVYSALDGRSSASVKGMLDALSAGDRIRLVEAMRRVEQLLAPRTADRAPYLLRSHRPGDMGWVVQRHGHLYWQEYRYDERFEALVAGIVAQFIERFDSRRERCWIAERDGEPVGSIFLVKKSKDVAKLRLLLVEPSARGLGIGKRLIDECLRFGRQAGYEKLVLWTQSELVAARRIYAQAGFELVQEKRHDSWGRTGLVSETWEMKLTNE